MAKRRYRAYQEGNGRFYRWRLVSCQCCYSDQADYSVQRFLDVKLLTPEEQKKVFEGTTTHERVTKLGSGGKSVEAERADVAGILEAAAGFH